MANKAVAGPNKEIIECATEHGGVLKVTYFFNDLYKSVTKEESTRAIVHEYDEKHRSIYREYLTFGDDSVDYDCEMVIDVTNPKRREMLQKQATQQRELAKPKPRPPQRKPRPVQGANSPLNPNANANQNAKVGDKPRQPSRVASRSLPADVDITKQSSAPASPVVSAAKPALKNNQRRAPFNNTKPPEGQKQQRPQGKPTDGKQIAPHNPNNAKIAQVNASASQVVSPPPTRRAAPRRTNPNPNPNSNRNANQQPSNPNANVQKPEN